MDSAAAPFPRYKVGQNAGTGDITGIDRFAWVARHEWRHHEQWTKWWKPRGGWQSGPGTDDVDGDGIPDSYETPTGFIGEGGPFNPNLPRTVFFAPNIDEPRMTLDSERHAYFTQAVWIEGSADKQDWAKQGNQWMYKKP